MPDLRVKGGRHTARLTLCGQPAWTSTFVAELALVYRRPIVPIYLNRLADGSFEFIIEPAIDQRSGDRLVIQQLINDSMSARILAQPGAWALWNTNRWGP
jgi:lauroyl/myristoyl acyltransferase